MYAEFCSDTYLYIHIQTRPKFTPKRECLQKLGVLDDKYIYASIGEAVAVNRPRGCWVLLAGLAICKGSREKSGAPLCLV